MNCPKKNIDFRVEVEELLPTADRTASTDFLGAFAKLQKATVRFVMSVCLCLSGCMEQHGSHWTDFDEI